MKKFVSDIVFGRGNALSGLVAFAVVALVLGCSCGKNLDLGNLGKDTGNSSNTTHTSSNTFGDAPSSPPKTTSTTKSDASKGEVPAESELQAMAKETLLDFNSAVKKADFSDFYSHISKEWQKQTSPDSMKTTFQSFIDKGIKIDDIGSLDAQFSPSPSIGREVGFKTLMMEGKYATSPQVTKFQLNYIANGKDWKLSKIVVDTTEKAY